MSNIDTVAILALFANIFKNNMLLHIEIFFCKALSGALY